MFRVRATLIALGATSLALTGCAPAESRPSPDLTEFYGQQIAFEPCAPYATTAVDEQLFANDRFECARVQVPLDYADPDGPRGEVALLRLPARGEKIGSLLVNPGGPGGSGMSFAAQLAPLWDAGPVGERFDVIGFDPRGVGASTPQANCYTDAEKERGEDFAGQLVPDVPDAQAAREVAQRCSEGSGGPEALASFGTTNVVRDMDVLRSVLGDEKLSYMGWSYGTQLGGMYAEAFPQNVRALALDGAFDPELTTAEFQLAQMKGIQQAFDRFAANCVTSADCPLGTDPDRANEEFQALVRPLLEHPAPTADGRGLNYDGAMTAVTSALYSPSLWPKATEGLAELATGRGDLLLAQRDVAAGRGPDGKYSNSGDAVYAIRCMDAQRRTPAEQTEFARQVQAAVPFADPGLPVPQSHHECEAWPEPPTMPQPWLTGPVDVPPTLTVSITGDPATPYQGGVNLARALDGSLLTVDGAQHGITLLGQSKCVDDIVADYLINLRTPPENTRCTA